MTIFTVIAGLLSIQVALLAMEVVLRIIDTASRVSFKKVERKTTNTRSK